ncbi:hypothetical protein ACN23B_16905 [Anabaena sp. FACHB-709]|uniref:Uncharacterized protein n=2 Tax=Nostocaceae TaxID=1162 RepID=A0A1Z4KJ36_ANAVA|nr:MULTISPECIES: hypothetical protein [Nostocaceae]RUR75676.1 hypothetical protein DSM107007_48350 [Nostoc sp. PCC 7120 = FACHB-418]BAB75065.1 alr3366 [Nostoc sp. PCC 7120 = FACHB-418]BAY68996.1 hypothetical protein NIES23_17860 [Trichormus variabilis NIES-23]
MSNNDEILNKLQTIVYQLQVVSSNQIDVLELNQIETDLESILPQLQFEMTDARMDGNWAEANELREAYEECKNALERVRAAIIKSTIIGINQENLTEMRRILDEVQTTSKTQKKLKLIVSSLRLVQKLFR